MDKSFGPSRKIELLKCMHLSVNSRLAVEALHRSSERLTITKSLCVSFD